MTRRRYYPSQLGADRPGRNPGLASSPMESECHRCGFDIEDWRQAAKVNGRWVHKGCMSGASDE